MPQNIKQKEKREVAYSSMFCCGDMGLQIVGTIISHRDISSSFADCTFCLPFVTTRTKTGVLFSHFISEMTFALRHFLSVRVFSRSVPTCLSACEWVSVERGAPLYWFVNEWIHVPGFGSNSTSQSVFLNEPFDVNDKYTLVCDALKLGKIKNPDIWRTL